jgi:hypothetical protein
VVIAMMPKMAVREVESHRPTIGDQGVGVGVLEGGSWGGAGVIGGTL